MKRLPFYRTRLEVPDDQWNFLWLCRYGLGFRLWLVELQVYWYKPGGPSAEVPRPPLCDDCGCTAGESIFCYGCLEYRTGGKKRGEQ